jgi:uncharacterized OB-fold protein
VGTAVSVVIGASFRSVRTWSLGDVSTTAGTVELTHRVGEILTWTTVSATPPGVREPNTLALVEFTVDDRSVRILGGTTTDEVSRGDRVRPAHVAQLRDPAVCIRENASQRWDGWRFEPAEN